MGWLIDATIDNYRKEIIERMELLRRDPDLIEKFFVNDSPKEIETRRMFAECANDMLDDCIEIVKEVMSVI